MGGTSYLQVEHAGCGGVLELGLGGALLEESVDLCENRVSECPGSLVA